LLVLGLHKLGSKVSKILRGTKLMIKIASMCYLVTLNKVHINICLVKNNFNLCSHQNSRIFHIEGRDDLYLINIEIPSIHPVPKQFSILFSQSTSSVE
jgi:hypothetical protein